MTTILERAISILAPNQCISCSNQNNIICDDCLLSLAKPPKYLCLNCTEPTAHTALCVGCSAIRQTSPLPIWIAADYKDAVAAAIKKFKFDRSSAAAKPLADLMAVNLPVFLGDALVVPVPTASSRIRIRGYDHTLLLAKALSKAIDLPFEAALARQHNKRQVGANRQERQTQAQNAFVVPSPAKIAGRRILLIDDVITTGATVLAAADVLRWAGAARVAIAAIAYQPHKD